MARFEDMSPTRRRVRGPLFDLVELSTDDGTRFVAMVFHEAYRSTQPPDGGVAAIADFMALPMVSGIAPLAVTLPGLLVYQAEELRTARELIAVFGEEGGCGPRAALELFSAGARSLLDAAAAGQERGLVAHGSLDPWHVGVTRSGDALLLAYGVPAADASAFVGEGEALLPDRVRYAAPERFTQAPDDVTGDLFSLAMVCAELSNGRPVYLGDPAALVAAARAGTAGHNLQEVSPVLASVLEAVLVPDPAARRDNLDQLPQRAREAARRAEGRTLREILLQAQDYLSDVEDELPRGFRSHELLPPDPLRDEAGKRASAASVRASAAVTALDTFLRGILDRVDESYPEVAEAMATARRSIDEAQTAADAARLAGERALRAPDGSTAQRSEEEAGKAAEAAKFYSAEARAALERASRHTSDARASAAERRAEIARTNLDRAAQIRDRLASAAHLDDEVLAAYKEAREAARSVTGTRDPEQQEAGLARLTETIRTLDGLEARALAAEEAIRSVDRIQRLLDRFPGEATALGACLARADEALQQARTSSDHASVQQAAERAAACAEEAASLPAVVHALEGEAEEAIDRARVALDGAETAFSNVPHEDVERHVQAARRALERAVGEPALAPDAAADAERAAAEADRIADQLATRRTAARSRAEQALERARLGAAGLSTVAVEEALAAVVQAAGDAASAKLPAQAGEAAARTEELAAEVERVADRTRAARRVALDRTQSALAKARGAVSEDHPRWVRLQELAAAVDQAGGKDELAAATEAVVRAADELVEVAAVEASRLGQAAEDAQREVERAEQARAEATSDAIEEAISQARSAAAAVVSASQPEDALAALERARLAADAAHEAADRAVAEARHTLEQVQSRAEAHAKRALESLSEASTPVVEAHVEQAQAAAARARAAGDLAVAEAAANEARAAAEAAHQAAAETLGALQSLQRRTQAAAQVAEQALASVPTPEIEALVRSIQESAAAVAATVDPADAESAVESAEASADAARTAALSALQGVRQRARHASEHASRALAQLQDDDARIHANIAIASSADAEAAPTLMEALQATQAAESAARAIEVVRARAALEIAKVAVARSPSGPVRQHVDACRDAVNAADQAIDLREAETAADAAMKAAELAREAASTYSKELEGFVDRAQEALATAEAAWARTGHSTVEAQVARAREAVVAARDARTLESASAAVREAQAAAAIAEQEATQFTRDHHAARSRAQSAMEQATQLMEHAHVPGVSEAVTRAKTAAGEALSSERPDSAEPAVLQAEESLESARKLVSRHRQALAENIRRAMLAVEEAEAILAESNVDGVRNAVLLARSAAAEAESAEDLFLGETAASAAEQAASAAANAHERYLRKNFGLARERAAAAAQRATAAAAITQNQRVRAQADAARRAAERTADASTLEEANAAAEAAEAAADDAQAVVDGALEVARHRATQAANRVSELVKEASIPSLRALMLTCRQAAASALKTTDPKEAELAADRAEAAANEAQEEVDGRQSQLEEAQNRALSARNRAEESLTDPPLAAVVEAVSAARNATDEALASDVAEVAIAAAERAEDAAMMARAALEAQLSQLEVYRTRAREALKRAEKALWEADLEPTRNALKDARAGVRQAVNAEGLPTAERGARRAEQAAEMAEASLREHKLMVDSLIQRTEEAVRRAEDALRITGSDEVRSLVAQARSASALVSRAAEVPSAQLQTEQAEAAASRARLLAEEAVESRATARRRAARGLAQAEAARLKSDLPEVLEAVAAARNARDAAEQTADPAAAHAAADRAEEAARAAEAAIAAEVTTLKSARKRAEAAYAAARAALEVGAGAEVEAWVEQARRAVEAGADAMDLAAIESCAERAEAAARSAREAADQAAQRCRAAHQRAVEARGRAYAALQQGDDDLVRVHFTAADGAAERAQATRDPDAAEAEAANAEAESKAAQRAVKLVRARLTADRAQELVHGAASATAPDGAPSQIVAMADEVWRIVNEVQREVQEVRGATEAEAADEHAEAATTAAARALSAQESLQDAIRGWRADLKSQARTGLKALRGLSKRLQQVTSEIRMLDRTGALAAEAQGCEQEGQAAGAIAQVAASEGDPDGVRNALNDLRRTLKRAQRGLEQARAANPQGPGAADARKALQAALDEATAMADEARRLLQSPRNSDSAWHAQRAAEAADAARLAATAALQSGQPLDVGPVATRLERAVKALARVRGDTPAPEGALAQLRMVLALSKSSDQSEWVSDDESVGDQETVGDIETVSDGLAESSPARATWSAPVEEDVEDEVTAISVKHPGQPFDPGK